ncbi:hypothetical protein [Labrenzia sp. PHM005]|uniref:hypothetical protein n=1 Tax=Labrenzia sp. PHM005 TaxID=2590016 RepID=UPI001140405E|nr:hypothetical protein [Labrenzia sp. PHM005]QDG77712.1 hypothetical protein FJ695_18610 [Labrenzia sp. PHM005]
MADYILNHVIVDGTRKQIDNLLVAHFRKLSGEELRHRPFTHYDFLWQDIIPMPEEVATSRDEDKIRNWQLYNWSCFGTGKEVTETNFGNRGTLNFRFPTLGAEPRPVYTELVKRFPRLKFNFASISMPNFCLFIGTGIDGKLLYVDDDYD